MRKIKVLQITQDLGVGGLERVVVTLCRKMDRSRFDVAVLCLRGRGPLAEELGAIGVPVHDIGGQDDRADYLGFLKVARVLRRLRVDVVHSHNTHALLDGWPAAKLAGVRRIVHTDHGREYPDKLRYVLAERALAPFVHRIVAVSDHTARELMRYQKIPATRIVTIPNGIDGDRYDIEVDREAKRAELGVGRGDVVLGLGARLTAQKGVTYLLQAVAALAHRLPSLSVVIAGTGELEASLRAEARALGISGRVRFVGVRLDMPELLKAFDVYMLPSVWEGLPMAVLEAMAAGLPVIASGVGGVPTAVEDGVNGLLVPPRDPERLAAAIERLALDEAMRRRFGAAGRRIFLERFSADAMARQYEALYLGEAPRAAAATGEGDAIEPAFRPSASR